MFTPPHTYFTQPRLPTQGIYMFPAQWHFLNKCLQCFVKRYRGAFKKQQIKKKQQKVIFYTNCILHFQWLTHFCKRVDTLCCLAVMHVSSAPLARCMQKKNIITLIIRSRVKWKHPQRLEANNITAPPTLSNDRRAQIYQSISSLSLDIISFIGKGRGRLWTLKHGSCASMARHQAGTNLKQSQPKARGKRLYVAFGDSILLCSRDMVLDRTVLLPIPCC